MDLRQSKEFAHYMRLSGWRVEKVSNCFFYIRKLPLLPPLIMKAQYPNSPIPFEGIEKLAKKYKPLQIQIQPLKTEPGLEKYGYRLSGGGHVTKTLQINLNQSEKKIREQMKKDARYSLRKAEKEKLQIIEILDLEKFRQAWRKAVGWRKYVPSLKNLKNLKKAFTRKALFLTAQSQGKIVGGTIILTTNSSAYYYSAFTSKEGRKKLAQYLLVWEAMRLTKKRGCQIFDFEGTYDQRFPIKDWQGFSHFKKSFGGQEVEYPGCFKKIFLNYPKERA
ncbi:MAG TPA: peptidoglycan bridge formation glycyltransferase FemA/FemB family protein [Patescibacteria group bacterium]|nr:peptidoglycan bridge formation glycyltransferase FemA/FemB family protein [Patescibacteria group bacterium]